MWRDSWLETDADKNECPFCGCGFDPRGAEVIKLPRIKKKRLHYKQVSSVKLVCRLSSNINDIDWSLFKKDNYLEMLQRRTSLIEKLNQTIEKLIDRLGYTKRKSGILEK